MIPGYPLLTPASIFLGPYSHEEWSGSKKGEEQHEQDLKTLPWPMVMPNYSLCN